MAPKTTNLQAVEARRASCSKAANQQIVREHQAKALQCDSITRHQAELVRQTPDYREGSRDIDNGEPEVHQRVHVQTGNKQKLSILEASQQGRKMEEADWTQNWDSASEGLNEGEERNWRNPKALYF